MKKYFGWTDDDIKKNFNDMIKDKQMTAIAEYMGELVSAENPPVDIKSPFRLKTDVEKEQAVDANGGKKAESGEAGGEGSSGDEAGGEEAGNEAPSDEESTPDVPPVEEPDIKQSEEPTFGLS